MSEKLHLGCGNRILPGWINCDQRPAHEAVIRLDVREPMVFADESFTNVFCEHVFEHLNMEEAAMCAREIHRILKPNGVFRVVVPDAILRERPEIFPNKHRHITAWTYISLRWLLGTAMFSKIEPVRYYDVDGALHLDCNLLTDETRGPVFRVESLIFDAIK